MEDHRRHFTNKRTCPQSHLGSPFPYGEWTAPGSGLMVAIHVQTISRTGKNSGSTLAVSMVLVWKIPTDKMTQRLSSYDIGPVKTRIGVSHLVWKTRCAFYLTWLTHLLVCCFALQALQIMI